MKTQDDFRIEDYLFPSGVFMVKEVPSYFRDFPRIGMGCRNKILQQLKGGSPHLPWHEFPSPRQTSVHECAVWLTEQPTVFAHWLIETADMSPSQRACLKYYHDNLRAWKNERQLIETIERELDETSDDMQY